MIFTHCPVCLKPLQDMSVDDIGSSHSFVCSHKQKKKKGWPSSDFKIAFYVTSRAYIYYHIHDFAHIAVLPNGKIEITLLNDQSEPRKSYPLDIMPDYLDWRHLGNFMSQIKTILAFQ